MSTSITVYQSEHTLRVVAGEHKPHEGARAARVRVYPSAKLAYAAETTNEVRSAILRIDPTAAPEPGDGPLGPIAPVTIPAGALARPTSRTPQAFKRFQSEREDELTAAVTDDAGLTPGQCAHPDGCDNRAADGDIYCTDCREAIEVENDQLQGDDE